MLKLITHIKETTQVRWNGLGRFRPKISLSLELGPYLIKTADSVDELLKTFRLRHEVFHREFREIMRYGLDIDKHDRSFDHLLIVHKASQNVVGTYRLRASESLTTAYTAQEFDMQNLTDFAGPYLELGRACIHRDHRKGAVMALLFRGIAEYMNQSRAQTLFGCSSVKVHQPREAALVYEYLRQQGHVVESSSVAPTDSFQMLHLDKWVAVFSAGLSDAELLEAEKLVPSLVKMYLKMGAKIVCLPAYDKDFKCIDLLTALKTQELEASLAKRFQVISGVSV